MKWIETSVCVLRAGDIELPCYFYGARIEIFPWMILSISSFVQLVSETVMKLKMVAGDEEYKEDRKSRILFELIFGSAVLIFLIIYGGAFILATAV